MNILGLRSKLSWDDLNELTWCLWAFAYRENCNVKYSDFLGDTLFFRDRAELITALEDRLKHGAKCFRKRRAELIRRVKAGHVTESET